MKNLKNNLKKLLIVIIIITLLMGGSSLICVAIATNTKAVILCGVGVLLALLGYEMLNNTNIKF